LGPAAVVAVAETDRLESAVRAASMEAVELEAEGARLPAMAAPAVVVVLLFITPRHSVKRLLSPAAAHGPCLKTWLQTRLPSRICGAVVAVALALRLRETARLVAVRPTRRTSCSISLQMMLLTLRLERQVLAQRLSQPTELLVATLG